MTEPVIFRNIRLATMAENSSASYGLIEDGVVITRNGRIEWAGAAGEAAAAGLDQVDACTHDFGGRLMTPGLVDCHTHLVYAGSRAREFEMRLEGASYESISRAGGGIVSTVGATRAATEATLVSESLPRLRALMNEGATCIEIKSGYGLSTEHELKMLRVARHLGASNPVMVRTSFLGAHALPAEYEGRSDAYIDLVCEEMIPKAAEADLADAVDGFCEGIAFTPAQIERVFEAARAHELPVKLHAEQLSDLGGAALCARYGGLSADHLEYLKDDDIPELARAGTVAVLLPGAYYFLRETKLPPLQALRDGGVPIALASDANPGSSPLTSLLLTMNLACTLFRMTPEEALAGVTRNGARALGLGHECGTIEPGKRADLAVWDVDEPAELAYRMGFNPLAMRIAGGEIAPVAPAEPVD